MTSTPANLGVTYVHEHLIIDSPIVAELFPHIYLPSVEEAVAETETCREAGVTTMVDAMPYGGSYLDKLREVSFRTGMQVVASTGLHTEKYYPDDTPIESVRFSADVAAGCGVFKAATGPEGINPRALQLFTAMAETHLETGVPIITHCEDGHGALAQIELLTSLGCPIESGGDLPHRQGPGSRAITATYCRPASTSSMTRPCARLLARQTTPRCWHP